MYQHLAAAAAAAALASSSAPAPPSPAFHPLLLNAAHLAALNPLLASAYAANAASLADRARLLHSPSAASSVSGSGSPPLASAFTAISQRGRTPPVGTTLVVDTPKVSADSASGSGSAFGSAPSSPASTSHKAQAESPNDLKSMEKLVNGLNGQIETKM
jgi:hypothetical protein